MSNAPDPTDAPAARIAQLSSQIAKLENENISLHAANHEKNLLLKSTRLERNLYELKLITLTLVMTELETRTHTAEKLATALSAQVEAHEQDVEDCIARLLPHLAP